MSDYITGLINSTCRITGAGFYALSGIELPKAGFINFNTHYSDPEYIEFNIPENVSYGKINFYFITGDSLQDPLYVSGIDFFPTPRIDSVIPASQEVGEYVAISGAALSGVTYVSFNNITGTEIFYSEASGGLMVKVPEGYTTGPIRVSGFNNSGIVKAVSDFNFFGRIFLSGFSSSVVYEGDLITISGKNFTTSFFDDSYFPVSFKTQSAGFESGYVIAPFTGSSNKISGIVPKNSIRGNISLISKDNTSFTSQDELNILKIPVVSTSLGYYLNSGDSNSIIGYDLNNVSGIIFSGYNYRKPKRIFNSGVLTKDFGPFGKSMFFSGNSYLVVNTVPSGDTQFNSNDFTIEFWINPAQTMPTRVDLFNDFSDQAFYFYKNSTTWRFFANGSDRVTIPEANTPVNTWTKISISKIGSTTNGRAINSSSSYSSDYAGAYSPKAGSELYIGRTNTGQELSLGVNSFVGYLADFRIINGSGLYSSSISPTTGVSLSDDAKTVLLLKGEYSRFNIESGRNNLKEIPYISGNIDDYNYGVHPLFFNATGFTKNSAGSIINYVNNTFPGSYDIILQNTGSRNFTFKDFKVTKDSPVISNISTLENYISEDIDIDGFNFYPGTNLFLTTAGETGNQIQFLENSDYLSYQSLYREPNQNIIANSVNLVSENSKYDGKTFRFTNTSGSYLNFNISNSNTPLSLNNPFTFELDFKLASAASSDKFLISIESGLNIFVNSDKLFISGVISNTNNSIFSGLINTTDWNRLSIFKSLDYNQASGGIILNNIPVQLSNTGDSSFDFTQNFSLISDSSAQGSKSVSVYVGRDLTGTASSYWDGYIDEIRVMHDSAYKDRIFCPIKRSRNNTDTDILIHANIGLFDDNIRDFGYFKAVTPAILPARTGSLLLDNGFSSVSGFSNETFTFLQPAIITNISPSVLKQGEIATGIGSDLYYIKDITVGGLKSPSFNISGSGNQFSQILTFTVPELAQSGDSLNIVSDYFQYTFPSDLTVSDGSLVIDGFSPTTGIGGTLISISGKFLNFVSSLQLSRQNGNYQFINSFLNQSLSGLDFIIPDINDLADGPIVLNGNTTVVTSGILQIVNPIVSNITPLSAYFEDEILLSGSYLSGIDFYGIGYNNDYVKFEILSSISGTGVVLKVPREIKNGSFVFFPSGASGIYPISGILNTSGASGQLAGFSIPFIPSTTITGCDSETYRTQDSIIVTGINAHIFQTRDLYISGYNFLTNKTGQYIIAQNLTTIDDFTLTGSGFYQPYTGYSVLSGKLNVASSSLNSIPDIELLLSGSDVLGLQSDIIYDNYSNLDGFIGSGQIFFQRNSFDSDKLFQTITIKPPEIKISGLSSLSGSTISLITLSGSNLNYVTGIRFSGIGKLIVAGTGNSAAIPSVQAGYSTGIVIDVDSSILNSNILYKDFNKIQFYPPSVNGKNIHGKDVEDIRPVSGEFYLMTYLNEIYNVSGNFSYIPLISLEDAFLNNRLTFNLDGSNLVSGWDGSIVSFKGQGVRHVTGVDFYSESNNSIIEVYPSVFNIDKKKAVVEFYNAFNSPVTGYKIYDGGAGYTKNSIDISGTVIGRDPLKASGIISFLPPFVGQVTGIKIVSQDTSLGYTTNRFTTGLVDVENPLSGFLINEPTALLFTGDDYSTQKNDGYYYSSSYTLSTTYPLQNDFVVGEQLNFRLKSPSSTFTTVDLPFLVIQNPNNYARITDIILTGSSYEEKKNFRINYSQFYTNDDSYFELLDAQIKTSILYPTGYTNKQFSLTSFKPSKNGKFIDIEFSSTVPATGNYVINSDEEESKYLKLRIEAINSQSSSFKGLGAISSTTVTLGGKLASRGTLNPPS